MPQKIIHGVESFGSPLAETWYQGFDTNFRVAVRPYLARTPNHDQTMDWLAMMQHYGAPTRLLDWTRSPYVDLYFVLRNQKEANAALWSIDLTGFEQRSLALLRQKDPAWPDGSNFRTQCE
jgi:FRG domain